MLLRVRGGIALRMSSTKTYIGCSQTKDRCVHALWSFHDKTKICFRGTWSGKAMAVTVILEYYDGLGLLCFTGPGLMDIQLFFKEVMRNRSSCSRWWLRFFGGRRKM